MRTVLSLLTLALLLGAPAVALADAIPGCPPGQHVVFNPVPPGSHHHGGAHCEPDAPPHGRRTPPPPPPPPPPPAPPSGSGGSRS